VKRGEKKAGTWAATGENGKDVKSLLADKEAEEFEMTVIQKAERRVRIKKLTKQQQEASTSGRHQNIKTRRNVERCDWQRVGFECNR